MLILNADDWGAGRSATDAALATFEARRITSVSAMVFMEDSHRAADLANRSGIDVGLHINYNQPFTGLDCPAGVAGAHHRIVRFLRAHKYAQLIYQPWLRNDFRTVFAAQLEEFVRLYGRAPTHFDGHQHMHLCTNSLLDRVIPKGSRVRRSFSFQSGEKNFLNRTYRRWVDNRLQRDYLVTDYFFALSRSLARNYHRGFDLAKGTRVEIMTHPEASREYAWLMSDDFLAATKGLHRGSYALL